MKQANKAPVFKLYGELEQWITPDLIHCETIASRSSLHNWHIEPHQHHGLFQILYLQHGRARITLDDRQSDMEAGQVLLVPQRFIHGFQFDHSALGYVITVAYPLLARIARHHGKEFSGLTAPSLHRLGDDIGGHYTRMAILALDAEYRQPAAHRQGQIETLLTSILVWGDRYAMRLAPSSVVDKGSRHFAHFERLIEESYTLQHPVSHYAKCIGITAAHLNAIARDRAGKSALELIHERVLLEAKRNLAYTSMTISVLSYALGFAEPAYFARFFKRHMGLAPKDFRKQASQLTL